MVFMHPWRWAGVLLLIVGPALLIGCSGPDAGPPRYSVTGTVTFDGEPVNDGQVLFLPADGGGQPDAGQLGAGGKFEFQVTAGKKRVEITGFRKTGEITDEDTQETMPVTEAFIPARYNTESELTVEVKPNGENTHKFDLTSE